MSFPKNSEAFRNSLPPQDCFELVGKYRETNDGRFIIELFQLVEGPYKALSRVILKYIRDPEARRDFVNDLYIKFTRLIHESRIERNCKGWFFQVVKNEAINFINRADNRRNEKTDSDIPEKGNGNDAGESYDLKKFLQDIQRYLGPEDWEILKLHYQDGKSYQEAAEELGISYNQYRGRLDRIRAKVHRRFGPNWEGWLTD